MYKTLLDFPKGRLVAIDVDTTGLDRENNDLIAEIKYLSGY